MNRNTLLTALNHFTHDFSHQRLSLVGSLLNFLMADLYGIVEAAQIGDDANAESADAAVVGHDDFWDGRHANGVATQCAIHLIFSRCLKSGTSCTDVYTIYQTNFLLLGNLGGQVDELVVISLVHIREAGTCGEVLATQRMFWEEIDMVGDNHQVANLEGWVHTTCCIADEERLDAKFVHNTDREGDFLHRVALIVVETALHGHNVYTTELTEDECASVSFYGRYWEIWDFCVGDFQLVSYF